MVCLNCKKETNNPKYCSLRCANLVSGKKRSKLAEEKRITNCIFCGKEFIKKKNNPKQKFCSRSCSAKKNNQGVRRHGNPPKPCANCGEKTNNPKFCSNACQHAHKRQTAFFEIEKTQCVKTGKCGISNVGRQYLIETRGYICEVCNRETWNGIPITLELDHINGKSMDNRLKNIRLICPNCHSQTKNYRAKNKNCDRHWRNK